MIKKNIYRVIRKVDNELGIHIFPDKLYLKAMYYLIFGRNLNLRNPKTFNEKLQWLKLYDRNPEYTKMVDKYEAKKYVNSIIGEGYTIPTFGVYDQFSDIDFNSLPNKFVLKCTHDSGGIVICRDKELFNKEEAKKKLQKAFNRNFYYVGREWPYKNVKPRIIAEQYMEDDADGDLKDYKFFCFNVKVKFFKVDFNREKSHRANYYDNNGNLLSLGEVICPPDFNKNIVMPSNLNQMIKLAEKISADKCFVRVDFYSLSDKDIKFGEITFYPASGFGKFIPDEEDKRIGEMLNISVCGGGYSIYH